MRDVRLIALDLDGTLLDSAKRLSERNRAALARAAELGFHIVLQQILTDNEASLRLHEKLGFESDGYVYRNAKGREVTLWLKAL